MAVKIIAGALGVGLVSETGLFTVPIAGVLLVELATFDATVSLTGLEANGQAGSPTLTNVIVLSSAAVTATSAALISQTAGVITGVMAGVSSGRIGIPEPIPEIRGSIQVKSSTTEVSATTWIADISYRYAQSFLRFDPSTNGLWTTAAINAMQMGIKRIE